MHGSLHPRRWYAKLVHYFNQMAYADPQHAQTHHRWSRLFLAPFAFLYGYCIRWRLQLYRRGYWRSHALPVPVIVVGNLTLGGTGKTPFVMALATHLHQRGLRVGILLRGFGGKKKRAPVQVFAQSDPLDVGDEAVELAQRLHCPIVVGAKRAEAGAFLLSQHPCDLLICDDGLQHYALKRDLEIGVVDGSRGFGNGRLFPAGPLREPLERAASIPIWVCNSKIPMDLSSFLNSAAPCFCMRPQQSRLVHLMDPNQSVGFEVMTKTLVHAVTGIGNPQRFFASLRAHGFQIIEHAFPDHHVFRPEELDYADFPLIMTHKDAVKCRRWAKPNWYYLEVTMELPSALLDLLSQDNRIKNNQ